jgi:hypothetical protein
MRKRTLSFHVSEGGRLGLACAVAGADSYYEREYDDAETVQGRRTAINGL